MSDAVAAELNGWAERPPMIIDESDGEISTARKALAMGYGGTSHKNCKGIFKGLANACLIEHRRRTDPSRAWLLSGEDLSNVGPIALPQDLAAVATFGLTHCERNGHHYFKGLSLFPESVQSAVLAAHPDLFHRHPGGFVAVNAKGGQIRIDSVVDAPFGSAAKIDPTIFTPVAEWSSDSLDH